MKRPGLNYVIDNKTADVLFSGRGKTFVLSAIIAEVRGRGKVALCCASSAFAAAFFPGGRTAHNLFKIDVVTEKSPKQKVQCSVSPNSSRAELLRAGSIVIWDEFPMSHKHNFEAVDSMLRIIRRCPDKPCGGILFIGSGDFRQIPPVVPSGTMADIVNASIKSSQLWSLFEQFALTVPMRQAKDAYYAK